MLFAMKLIMTLKNRAFAINLVFERENPKSVWMKQYVNSVGVSHYSVSY